MRHISAKPTNPSKIELNYLYYLLALILCGLPVFSCAPPVKHYVKVNQCLVQQDYTTALLELQKNKAEYKERNAALYYLEEGLIHHFAANYQQSNQSLAKAEGIMDALYTKSISKEAASFLINDNTVPYSGEDFENALVNLFMALNYAKAGLHEDALVEARKVDNKLNVLNSRYDDDKKNVYKEDAFIRFLMGVLYEVEGEVNDAFISYRKAEEIYRNDYTHNYGVSAPKVLIENLLRTGKEMGFYEEIAEIQAAYPGVIPMDPSQKRKMAEIYLIHYNGWGPEKVEKQWMVPMPDGYIAKIAYPEFQKKNYRIHHAEIQLRNLESGQAHQFQTEMMEDIGSIAVMNLENRLTRIKVKAIARATTKYLATKAASKAAEDQGGALVGLLVQVAGNVAAAASEKADLRHWRMLPAEIRVGRILVPPGQYEGEIRFVNASGLQISKRIMGSCTVQAGEKKFLRHLSMQ
jgi:hypothetical protein